MAESPGYNEARSGVPLVGKAGQTFNELLRLAGIDRNALYITNLVRCQPPHNRLRDYPEAVVACEQWTSHEFDEYDPRVVVLMGAFAIGQVFGANAKVGLTRGTVASRIIGNRGRRLYVATYHPQAAGYAGGAESPVGQTIVADLRAAVNLWNTLDSD